MTYGHFLAGDATAMLAALVTADLVFAGLFGAHLKRTLADGRRWTMARKTVTVFGATGTAGSACVDELVRQEHFNVQVLARKGGASRKRGRWDPRTSRTKSAGATRNGAAAAW